MQKDLRSVVKSTKKLSNQKYLLTGISSPKKFSLLRTVVVWTYTNVLTRLIYNNKFFNYMKLTTPFSPEALEESLHFIDNDISPMFAEDFSKIHNHYFKTGNTHLMGNRVSSTPFIVKFRN